MESLIAERKSIATSSPPSLTWRTYTSSDSEGALSAWRSLERRLASRSVASSAAWTDCWLRAYGDLIPHRFLAAEANGITQGICLLTEGVGQKFGPLGVRTRHLGTAGEPQPGSVCVEYNRPLVDPNFREAFIAGVAKSLQRDNGWEQFRLDGLSESDLHPWQSHFPNAEVISRESRYFDLKQARDSGTDVLSNLGRSTRSNIRRRLKSYGELQTEWASSVDQAAAIMHELIEHHQARWQAAGQPGAFASPRFRSFQEDACIRLFLEKRAVLFRVMHQNEVVGCLMLLVDENRLLDYLSGFADFETKPSPGMITHYLCMNEGLQRGYDAYDFLVGDKRHKDNLSTHSNSLCWLTWSRPSLKLQAARTLQKWKQGLSRLRTPRPENQGEQNS